MDYHSIINQSILAQLVERDVIMNASLLVGDLLEKDLLEYEDMENHYYDPCPECGGRMKEGLTEANGEGCPRKDRDHETAGEAEQEAREVYEWWFVTEWLYEKLRAQGQPVIASRYGFLWGRCTTGQAILFDGVIGRIAEDLEILAGQENEWSKD